MTKIFRLSLIQAKYQIRNLGFILLISTILFVICLPPYDNLQEKASLIFQYSTVFLMLVLFSGILSSEFEYKTAKIIFTSGLSRVQVMVQKLFTIVMLSIVLALTYNVIILGIKLIDMKTINHSQMLIDLSFSIVHFVIYGLCIGTFALLISTITFSSVFSFLFTYILFNGLFQSLILLLGEKHRNELVRDLVKHTPFYIANRFKDFSYTKSDMTILTIASLITFILACIILNKRDLKK